MADNDVAVQFGGSISGLTTAVQGVASSLGTLAGPVSALKESFEELGAVIATVFAIREVSEFVSKMEELGVATARAAAILGTSTDKIAAIDAAAKGSGISLESVEHAMARLGMALARADAGSEQARAGLNALGIAATDFVGLDAQGKFELLADKMAVLKDGADKDAIAMSILGRAGMEMIPFLNEGAHGFEKYSEMVERAGSKSFPEFEEAAHRSHLTTIELDQSMRGAGMGVFTIFEPAFSGLKQIMIDVVESFTAAIREGGSMRALFDVLAGTVKALATAFAIAVAAIETMWTVTKAVVTAIANDFIALGKIIAAAMRGDLPGIKAGWSELMEANKAVAINAAGEMERIFGNLTKEIKTTWGVSAEDHVKIEQTKNARLAILNKDAVTAAMAAEEQKRKAAEMTYQMAVEQANTQYKLSQTTEAQKTNSLLAALDVRHSAEMASLDRELAIHGLNKTQYQKLLNDRLNLDQKYFADRAKIVDQAMIEEKKNWDVAGNAIQGAFNSQLRGLLSGQTNFAQASKAILGDLVIKTIEYFEKMGFEWAAGKLAELTVQQTTDAAKLASQQAAQAAALPAKAASFMSDLTARAALVFAGVFANLAPFLGPAAAGPAAASEATVMAQAAAVPKLDVGTNLVMSSGLAMIHQGEAVIPAAQTSGPYEANAPAGTQVSVSVSAWDGHSVQRWLSSGGANQLAKAVSGAMTKNPSLRPGY